MPVGRSANFGRSACPWRMSPIGPIWSASDNKWRTLPIHQANCVVRRILGDKVVTMRGSRRALRLRRAAWEKNHAQLLQGPHRWPKASAEAARGLEYQDTAAGVRRCAGPGALQSRHRQQASRLRPGRYHRRGHIAPSGSVRDRAVIVQRKTGRPVQFEITEQTRAAVGAWIASHHLAETDFLFPSRVRVKPHLSTRQYGRIVEK